MQLLLEIIISIVLHPLAAVLGWIDLAGRNDLNGAEKALWALVVFVWGIGPILYILVAHGKLWGRKDWRRL